MNHIEKARDQLKHCTSIIACKDDKEIKKVLKSLSKEGYSLSTRAINDEYIHQFEDIDRAVYFATFDNEKRVEEFLEVTLFLMEKEDMEVFLDKTILGKDIPNEETIEAIQEVKEMEKNPSKFKRYYSFDEIIDEIEQEGEDES